MENSFALVSERSSRGCQPPALIRTSMSTSWTNRKKFKVNSTKRRTRGISLIQQCSIRLSGRKLELCVVCLHHGPHTRMVVSSEADANTDASVGFHVTCEQTKCMTSKLVLEVKQYGQRQNEPYRIYGGRMTRKRPD